MHAAYHGDCIQRCVALGVLRRAGSAGDALVMPTWLQAQHCQHVGNQHFHPSKLLVEPKEANQAGRLALRRSERHEARELAVAVSKQSEINNTGQSDAQPKLTWSQAHRR